MNVENIDIDALIALTKQAAFNCTQRIDEDLSDDSEFKDDIKPAIKEMLLTMTHNTICSQVRLILGIDTNSKKEYSDMREELDATVSDFVYGKINIDDLIRFIRNLYIEILDIESKKISERYSSMMERKTIMIGRQCVGH